MCHDDRITEELVAKALTKQVAQLVLSLELAKQDALRVFGELGDKVDRVRRMTCALESDPKKWPKVMELVSDCQDIMSAMRGMKVIGDSAWDTVDSGKIPDDEDKSFFA